jgi:hypothetical protein
MEAHARALASSLTYSSGHPGLHLWHLRAPAVAQLRLALPLCRVVHVLRQRTHIRPWRAIHHLPRRASIARGHGPGPGPGVDPSIALHAARRTRRSVPSAFYTRGGSGVVHRTISIPPAHHWTAAGVLHDGAPASAAAHPLTWRLSIPPEGSHSGSVTGSAAPSARATPVPALAPAPTTIPTPATRTAIAAVKPGARPSDAAATAAARVIDLAYRDIDILLSHAGGPMSTIILLV